MLKTWRNLETRLARLSGDDPNVTSVTSRNDRF
jgi:hypothetical protein